MSRNGFSKVRPGLFFGLVLIVFAAPSVRANLTITPTYSSSITSDPNHALIESVINSTIQIYENTFKDPINVAIEFNEMGSGLGESSDFRFKINYQDYYNALNADKTSANDATALSTLPSGLNNPVTGSTTINLTAATIRAIGGSAPQETFTPGDGYTGDGEIFLNTSLMNLTRPPGNPGKYDLQAVVSHEMDEVLGLGSDVGQTGFFADPAPEDLFRYSSSHTRNFTTSGDDAWFSINGTTNLVQFNQISSGDYGDWHTSATPEVQDAFGTPGSDPSLGSNELTALDVIGFDLVTPEPASAALLVAGAMLILPRRRARA